MAPETLSQPAHCVYFPTSHWRHSEFNPGPPVGDTYPGLQRHDDLSVCAADECAEFGGQDSHAAVPGAVLYVLEPHAVHGPPFAPVYPALQAQDDLSVNAVDECPAKSEHGVHASSPDAVLYVLMPHAVHRPSFPLVYPGLQTQDDLSVCAVDECAEFVGQDSHSALPDAVLYLPETHAVHGPPFGPVYPGLQVQFLMPAHPYFPPSEFVFSGQS